MFDLFLVVLCWYSSEFWWTHIIPSSWESTVVILLNWLLLGYVNDVFFLCLFQRDVVIHDARFSPNNAQFILRPNADFFSFYLVAFHEYYS